MYLPLMYCIKAVVCRLYEMLYLCICNVVISCWKSRAYDFVICRDGTDMCFVPESGWKHLDLEQYHILGLTILFPKAVAKARACAPFPHGGAAASDASVSNSYTSLCRRLRVHSSSSSQILFRSSLSRSR